MNYFAASERLRNETDAAVHATLVDRQAALRISIEQIIARAYGLTDDEVAAVSG
ncbi:hypothetical protein DSM43518_00218 [Mycobacterium marinum]|nr:hypothetical protein DSM43518_00218 [Mycobacterium marinum]RFZ47116.1 hypothetical protein MSS2_05311 [Mycobacterium marinum]RFZ49631.1 hypothetical protein MSS4_02603 [Mycobacterium marinum]